MNSCFVSFTFLCFSLLSDSAAFFLYLYLFWRANQMTKNRRRFVSRTLAVFYEGFL
jgi:hypothetical protein